MDYPFIKCLNPQHIRNQYTNETLVVNCGHCEACKNNRSALLSLKCQLESLSAKHTRFVTLTFATEFVPKMYAFCDDPMDVINYDQPSHFLFVDSENPDDIISDSVLTHSQLQSIYKKTNCDHRSIPYLRKRDLQLFMKRLRKYINNYTDEKIRYLAVGEYGPVHYYPHFHLLLWFEGDEAVAHIRKCVRASWRFGRIDVQKPIGDCSNYVAGYLNGTCHLPSLFTNGKSKPFCCHSRFLGEKFLQMSKEEVYEMPVADFVKRCVPLNGSSKEIFIWKALKNTYFPKTYGYSTLSFDELVRAYRLFEEASSSIPNFYNGRSKVTPVEHAHYVYNRILFGESSRFLDYFKKKYNVDQFNISSVKDQFIRQVYNDFSISRHFLFFVCDNLSLKETYRCVNLIKSFYTDLDYLNIKHQYEQQIDMVSHGYSIDDLVFFDTAFYSYNDNMDKFKESKLFRSYREKVMNEYSRRQKKKRLNDLNKLLFNF